MYRTSVTETNNSNGSISPTSRCPRLTSRLTLPSLFFLLLVKPRSFL